LEAGHKACGRGSANGHLATLEEPVVQYSRHFATPWDLGMTRSVGVPLS
jgi:hypothetical protein